MSPVVLSKYRPHPNMCFIKCEVSLFLLYFPYMIRVLILGGGFGGVETYRRLHKLTHHRDDISITLINRTNYFWFTPMLHEVATGAVGREHMVEPLREIVSCCTNRFVEAEIERINLEEREILTNKGVYDYDYLVIALGSITNFFDVPGAKEFSFGFRNLSDGVGLRNRVVRLFEEATHASHAKELKKMLSFVIVGGGPTGVELAAQLSDWFIELRHLYKEVPSDAPSITVLQSNERLLPQLTPWGSSRALSVLHKKGVNIKLRSRVHAVDAEGVNYGDDKRVCSTTVLWTSGVGSPLVGILPHDALTERGWLKTEHDGSLEGNTHVFGVGDNMCGGVCAELPQTAQAASDIGRQVADNIFSLIQKKTTGKIYFKHRGSLVPLGDWEGIAEIGKIKFGGKLAWWLRRTVFVQRLWSWSNRIRVVVDWTINIFRPRDTSEL